MKTEERQYQIEEYAQDCDVWESPIIDALFEEINDAIEKSEVPEDFRDEVFNYINERCTIKLF